VETEMNGNVKRAEITGHLPLSDNVSKKQKLEDPKADNNFARSEPQNDSLQEEEKYDLMENNQVSELNEQVDIYQVMLKNESTCDLGYIGTVDNQATDDFLMDSNSPVYDQLRTVLRTKSDKDTFVKTLIHYQEIKFNDYYHNDKEDHALVITCQERYWNWTWLEKGYGFQEVDAMNDAYPDPDYFAPRLHWRCVYLEI
jgi:hypothetical protein